MKTSRYLTLMASAIFAVGALGISSCSDDWNSHYEDSDNENAANQPSLFELIKADGSLKEFQRVLEHIGYDLVLDGPQSLTVWAPALTTEQADSIIALYDTQKHTIITMPDGSQRYIQDKDNKAITQFLQNHIALYGRSVYENYSDSIRMMNGKYMVLTENALNEATFVRKNVVANNGILYTLSSPLVFIPSVRDHLLLDADLDSVAAFYTLFDQYSLDESASVQRGIVNGKIVYADSVLNLSNQLYSTLGWIAREDSSYAFLAPTNDVWSKELVRFSPLFNYVKDVQNRDSVALLNAKIAIIRGRMFNMNGQRGKKIEECDSLVNTMYVRHKDYYGLNVFYQPNEAGGILDGLTPWSCSNGRIYKDTEGRVDPKNTFLESRYLMATSPRYFNLSKIGYAGEIVPAVQTTIRSFVDTVTYEGTTYDVSLLKQQNVLKGENYLEVAPLAYPGVKNTTSRMYFYLPNTFANLYYNVYLVMVPPYLSYDGYQKSEVLPMRFECYFHERLEEERTDKQDSAFMQSYPNDDLKYDEQKNDRKPEHLLKVPAGETHSAGSATKFMTTGNEIDIICIDKARKPTFSSYNFLSANTETVLRYSVASDVSNSALSRGQQTNIMRINRIIYIPFETEEEANNFQLDLSNLKEFNISL
ncbi:MAG: hypothetical protein K6C30_08240 [Bacteroidaceae bacterium]|nr:hypothetical protein [Bacteroidaceae bacterium]